MKKYFTFAALAIALASCSNEEIVPQESLKDTPITVTAGVAELTTRAGYEGTTTLPGTFYFSIDQNGETYDYTNVVMTKGSGNAYTTSPSILWAGSSTAPTVSAYTTAGTDFAVQTYQKDLFQVEASDLLGAISNNDVTINSSAISLTFRHLLCKLDVTYSWGTELSSIQGKSITSVEYQGFGTNVTLDRTTSAVTAGSATGSITAYVNDNKSEAIFAPQVNNPKIVIVVTINGVDRTFTVNVTAPQGGFVAGKRYTMNVAIGGTAVSSTSASIANGWTSGKENGTMTTN